MGYEVVASEIGAATTKDIRDVPADASSVVVLVLLLHEPPLRVRVRLGDIPGGGRGVHRGLVCSLCGSVVCKLFAAGSTLGCKACTNHRSRRQLEHRSRAWRRLGGELEDVVLRGLRPGRRTCFVSERVIEAARSLGSDDRERVEVLLRRAETALRVASSPEVSVRDVLQEYGDDALLVDNDLGWT